MLHKAAMQAKLTPSALALTFVGISKKCEKHFDLLVHKRICDVVPAFRQCPRNL